MSLDALSTHARVPLNSARAESAQAQFSVSDYGYVGDQQPYQIIQPSYPAPRWMGRYMDMKQALRECRTLCRLEGRPFRLVKWGKPVQSPCKTCSPKPENKLPNVRIQGVVRGLDGAPLVAIPVADISAKGQVKIYGADGKAKPAAKKQWIVNQHPRFRGLHKVTTRSYYEAVRAAEYLASHTGRRAYVCNTARCKVNPKLYVPVTYAQPGGLNPMNPNIPTGTTTVSPVTPQHFQELVEESRGGTFYGQGT